MITSDNAENSGKIFNIYGNALGLGDPEIITDDQITVSRLDFFQKKLKNWKKINKK